MTYTRDLPSSINKIRKELRAKYLEGVIFDKPFSDRGHREISVRTEPGIECVNVVRLRNDQYDHNWHVDKRNPECVKGIVRLNYSTPCPVKGQCYLHEWDSVWIGDDLAVAKAIAARTIKGLPEHNENLRTRYHSLSLACAKGRIHDGECAA